MSKIICWWSGGITSAVACKLAIEKYGKGNCKVIMLDTENEHIDTYRFLADCEKWYGLPIKLLKSSDYKNIEETWYRHNSLNTATGAICSYMLKRRVREKWEKKNKYTHQVFGFEFVKKEMNRAKSLELNHPQTKPVFPLIAAKMNKADCLKFVSSVGIDLPLAYSLGFHNNNCLKTGCVQGGIGYWKKIQKELPDLFEKMAKVEHALSDQKGVPVTMLKDQSKKAKLKAVKWKYANLVFLKPHASYPQLKSLDAMRGREVKPLQECNGFCGINDLNPNNSTEKEINFEL